MSSRERRQKDVHEIVLDIYDCVSDATRWSGVLQSFAKQINAVGAIVFEWDHADQSRILRAPYASDNYDPKQLQIYIQKCFEYEAIDQDVFESHSLRQDAIDLISDEVLAPDAATYSARPNVQILHKLGIKHRAAGLLNKDNTALARFSVQLGLDRGQLTPAERHYMSAVLPHFAKALDLARPTIQLSREHSALIEAMDRLRIGVCILDGAGRVVTQNSEFARHIEDFRSFRIKPNGVLEMTEQDAQAGLHRLKSTALNHGKFGARPRKEAVISTADANLCIELVPLTHSEEIGSKPLDGYVLYSTDTSLPVQSNMVMLRQKFQLTQAETEIADLIAQGLTNAQIAERRDRSTATINAQVKSILAKSQCTTRTQFVRTMMGFGASYLRNT